MFKRVVVFAVLLALLISPLGALAMMVGGTGNKPIRDPGWPKGASAVFNHQSRIAWCEGPIGGISWRAEGRADSAELAFILEDFAKIEAPRKQIVIHDGEGRSFWLNPNRMPEKAEDARINWTLSVSSGKMKVFKPAVALSDVNFLKQSPPRLDLYSATIDWDLILLPDGVEVIDQRLSSHGYSESDGNVLEGTVTDAVTGQPIQAAINVLAEEQGLRGARLPRIVVTAVSGEDGNWVIKNVPAGRFKVVVEAVGYAPRLLGEHTFVETPHWKGFPTKLLKASPLRATVTDKSGAPLEGVNVHLATVSLETGDEYQSPFLLSYRTDERGQFEAYEIPSTKLVMTLSKSEHATTRIGIAADTSRETMTIPMAPSAKLKVNAKFPDLNRLSPFYVVIKTHEDSDEEFSTANNIDVDGQYTFDNLPAGNYSIEGRGMDANGRQSKVYGEAFVEEGGTHEVTLQRK